MSGFDPVFSPSGASSRAGSVPDPGSTAGIVRYLREDATWQIPASVGPIEPPPAPGPALDQWACNVAGFLTYSVTRSLVNTAVNGIGLPVITDTISIVVQGLLDIFVPELVAIDATLATGIADLVSTYITGHVASFVAFVLDDVFWSKVHCYLYDAVLASPTSFSVALAAAATVLSASGIAPSWVLNGVALILQSYGFDSFLDIPISGFVRQYDCSTCGSTGEGGAAGPLQSGFDLVVSDGTNRATFVAEIDVVNATVSATGSVVTLTPELQVEKAGAVVGVRPALNVIDGANIVTTVADDAPNNRVNVTVATSGPLGMTNPMTTAGDIIVGGVAGVAMRQATGSDGTVLTVDPTTHLPAWDTPTPGFANPMTNVDDVIVGSTGGAAARLGVGSPGAFLGADPVTGHVSYGAVVAGPGITVSQVSGTTTIAASGSGGGGTGLTALGNVVAAVPTGSLRFTSIPGSYSHLMLKGIMRADDSGVRYLVLQLNGDTSSNYYFQWVYSSNTGAAGNPGAGVGSVIAGQINDAGGTPNWGSPVEIWIPCYANTNWRRTLHGSVGRLQGVNDTSPNQYQEQVFNGVWNSTNAVTQLDVFVNIGNVAQHSFMSLYGVA
jgi:hypothetical protein